MTSPSASSASSSSLALAPEASISSSSAAGGKAVSSLAAAGVFFFFLRAFLSFSWDRTAVVKAGDALGLRPRHSSKGSESACRAVQATFPLAHPSGHRGQGYFYHRGFRVPCVPVGHWAQGGPGQPGKATVSQCTLGTPSCEHRLGKPNRATVLKASHIHSKGLRGLTKDHGGRGGGLNRDRESTWPRQLAG